MSLSRQYLIAFFCAFLGISGLLIQIYGGFGSASAQNQRREASGPVPVETASVVARPVVEVREAVGTARAYNSVLIASKVSGIIERIDFQEGQMVQEGDVLIQFNRTERVAEKEQVQAELLKVEAQRDEAAHRLERATALRKTGAGTAAQVDDITAQVRALEGALASAKAAIRAADARLEDLTIRAPFSGHVGARNVSVGAYISPGSTLTTLDDLSTIRIDFSVPENLLGQLKVGQVVRGTSTAYPGREFSGKVSVIDTRVDPVTRSVRLTADFANPDEALKTGMFLSVKLEVASRKDALVIPEEAVVSDGMKHILFVVNAESKAERRTVELGQRQRGLVEIVSGVKEGENVIVRGVQRVRPNAVVSAEPAQQAAN